MAVETEDFHLNNNYDGRENCFKTSLIRIDVKEQSAEVAGQNILLGSNVPYIYLIVLYHYSRN